MENVAEDSAPRVYRIGVDARPLTSPMSGVARVISSVLRHFPEPERFHFVLYASREVHADFRALLDLPNIEWVQGEGWTARRAGLWFNVSLPFLLRREPVDLFWGSQQVTPPGMPREIPGVLTAYDLVLYFYPETMRALARMQQRAVMQMSVRRSDRILGISTQTRDDMVKHFDYPPEKAGVALLGYDVPPVPDRAEREQLHGEIAMRLGFRPNENYILAVSTIEPRKNYGTLIDAYIRYYRRMQLKALPLVIAGRRGWEGDDFYERLKDYQRESGKIYTLESLSDRHLNELYRSCAFFAMPSLYEGFGLPLLEALCHGRRAIASDIPCFHEIGGDAVRYIAPRETLEWARALEELTEELLAATSGRKPRPRPKVDFPVEQWNWDRTAAVYHRAFLDLLEPQQMEDEDDAVAEDDDAEDRTPSVEQKVIEAVEEEVIPVPEPAMKTHDAEPEDQPEAQADDAPSIEGPAQAEETVKQKAKAPAKKKAAAKPSPKQKAAASEMKTAGSEKKAAKKSAGKPAAKKKATAAKKTASKKKTNRRKN